MQSVTTLVILERCTPKALDATCALGYRFWSQRTGLADKGLESSIEAYELQKRGRLLFGQYNGLADEMAATSDAMHGENGCGRPMFENLCQKAKIIFENLCMEVSVWN